MASTTVTMALGDALAACLIDRKKFKKKILLKFHPGGSLGRRLLLEGGRYYAQGKVLLPQLQTYAAKG